MENKRKRTKSPKLKVKVSSDRIIFWDKPVLNRILKHLEKEKKQLTKSLPKKCSRIYRVERSVDKQVKLKCRQLPNVVKELRRALLRHEWDYVATLTLILCHPGVKYYLAVILKVCFVLLLNHPKSSFYLLMRFIRIITGYILDEDVIKFIKILLFLKPTRLNPSGRGKYIRKTNDYKVTRDPRFENL